jgi:hypothetical protein
MSQFATSKNEGNLKSQFVTSSFEHGVRRYIVPEGELGITICDTQFLRTLKTRPFHNISASFGKFRQLIVRFF